MRIRLIAASMMFVASSAFAVAPQFWHVRNAEEFLEGEIEGFAITARGELRPAPGLTKVASFTDPFVLSQTTAPDGVRYFGTGNDGKVYRLQGSELKLLYTAPEPEVYAVAYRDGVLYAGTSPHGKVYRIDSSGKGSVFFDPKQAYIWALTFLKNGSLAVATGVDGKLFVVDAKGEAKTWLDATDTHIRSLAERPDGSLLVGTSGKGRIYAVRGEGSAHALYDSALSEVSSLYIDGNGIGWAAGVSSVLPSTPPKQQQKPAQPQAPSSTTTSGGDQRKEEQQQQQQAGNVEVTFSFEESAPSSGAAGASELYKVHTDGFVELLRRFDRELIYAVSGGPNGGIVLATGPNGRIYEFRDNDLALIAAVPEKQVVSVSASGNSTLITTTNSGAVYRMDSTPSSKAEFRSAAKDVERFSRFGHYRIEGRNIADGRLAIAFRSGNTRTPDSTWSNWSAPMPTVEGTVPSPAGRYIQWKLTMPKPAGDLVVDGVSVGFINRNMAPTITTVQVQDPAVVMIGSNYPPSPQVLEATNPDEYGIFTSLDTPRGNTGADQGKRMFRKGYRTVTWKAVDENGDTLRYSVSFRKKGSDRWLRLRENIEETQLNFDTSQLPDGHYQLRLTVNDAIDNPDNPLSDEKQGIEFQVDNTPPKITYAAAAGAVMVRVSDELSTIGKVEFSADAEKWVRLTPEDGIADSGSEVFKLEQNTVDGKFVVVRAVDSFYNVGTESISVP